MVIQSKPLQDIQNALGSEDPRGSAGPDDRAPSEEPSEASFAEIVYDVGDVLLDEVAAVELRRQIINGASPKDDRLKAPLSADPTRSPDEKLREYERRVAALKNLSALAISGGGIRSAAFALGIAQGLEARGLLAKFDYLSTVSGGGYIGAFLTLWAQRAGYKQVADGLRNETAPLQHLRRYSSYLTPHKGLISSDTLTVVALYLRNLLLNWLVLLPVVLLGILCVKLLAIAAWSIPPTEENIGALGILSITFVGLALLDSLRQRPGWESEEAEVSNFVASELIPMFLGGITTSWAALKVIQSSLAMSFVSMELQLGAVGAVIWAIAWLIAFLLAKPEDEKNASTRKTIRTSATYEAVWAFSCFSASGALTAMALGFGFFSIASFANWYESGLPQVAAHAIDLKALFLFCCGPGVLIFSMFLGELVYVGLTSYSPWSEGEREWLARASGYHGRAAVGWVLASTLVFGGAFSLFELYSKFPDYKVLVSSYVVSLGGLAGALTAVLGKTSTTVAVLGRTSNDWKSLSATIALALAAPAFFIVLVSAASAFIDYLISGQNLVLTTFAASCQVIDSRLGWLSLSVAFFGVCASWAINPNRFSLHGLYRNRLIRAFLGASNAKRNANPFTDFDERDNLQLASLWPNNRPFEKLPPQFLVINCALNILATKELAWQERKAMSFTATPRSVGCAALRSSAGAFRRAVEYCRSMTVGTAITISGAAASPNMGYHSSPSLSVLLTMFNVRLGAWLGNPSGAGRSTYRDEGPKFAALPLVQEALGITSESRKYVYLSDGGHFENLGLYEMVRRRCRLIILSDGGCDPACTFEDLGNAVRKIWIDLRIKIDFEEMAISPRSTPLKKGPYCAIGRIHYRDAVVASLNLRDEVDESSLQTALKSTEDGILLYIKPGYQGPEPLSVASYAAANQAFPHESTGEQLYGEAQFEAYRALGEYIIAISDGAPNKPYADIETFLSAVETHLKTRVQST